MIITTDQWIMFQDKSLLYNEWFSFFRLLISLITGVERLQLETGIGSRKGKIQEPFWVSFRVLSSVLVLNILPKLSLCDIVKVCSIFLVLRLSSFAPDNCPEDFHSHFMWVTSDTGGSGANRSSGCLPLALQCGQALWKEENPSWLEFSLYNFSPWAVLEPKVSVLAKFGLYQLSKIPAHFSIMRVLQIPHGH